MNIFKKKRYITTHISNTDDGIDVPDDMWTKCPKCKVNVYKGNLNIYNVCPSCGACFKLTPQERISITADEGMFTPLDGVFFSTNPLQYPDYEKKLISNYKSTKRSSAVITGTCLIKSIKTVLCVMDTYFIMASLGTVEGEMITLAFEHAIEHKLPLVLFAASGGARMQEGIMSLMQMAKVSAAVKRHSEQGLLYICVLTDPTTGGVTASFAMQADIILAEPKAQIGFAGPRVIEQTTKQPLPEHFQSSEFQLNHGFVDKIVKRQELRQTLYNILKLHSGV